MGWLCRGLPRPQAGQGGECGAVQCGEEGQQAGSQGEGAGDLGRQERRMTAAGKGGRGAGGAAGSGDGSLTAGAWLGRSDERGWGRRETSVTREGWPRSPKAPETKGARGPKLGTLST